MKEKSLVLVVDDKPHNLQFLGKLLSDRGYELVMAESGEQALDFVKKETPDLILLDVMMPGMDGFEVCRRLKQDLAVRHIPVIFLSAKTDTDSVINGFGAGGVDYVTKPFNSAELLARIQTHIELKTLRGLLPICAGCKKIRDDQGFWNEVEAYFAHHHDVSFSHGICPECAQKLYPGSRWVKKHLHLK